MVGRPMSSFCSFIKLSGNLRYGHSHSPSTDRKTVLEEGNLPKATKVTVTRQGLEARPLQWLLGLRTSLRLAQQEKA